MHRGQSLRFGRAARLTLVVAVACGPPSSGRTGRDATAAKNAAASALADSIEALRGPLHVPGISAAVVEGGRVTFARAFGSADVAAHAPATCETLYPIASLTKSLTATLAMQLVERGTLHLDARVSDYLADDDVDPSTVVANYLSHTSDETPGAYFYYSGARYGRLRRILERAAGEPFYAILRERIFEPAKMDRTATLVTESTPIATLYRWQQGSLVPAPYATTLGSSAGVASTVVDLARFATALQDGTLVSASSWQMMTTARRDSNGRPLPYGLGFFVETYRGERVVWVYGQEEGNSGLMVLLPERRIAFVALANGIGLSAPYWLFFGKVERSPVALAFLHAYVFHDDDGGEDDRIARALTAAYAGDAAASDAMFRSILADDPRLATAADPTLLAAFARSDDPDLRAAGESIGRALQGQTPDHPRTLFDLGTLYARSGDDAHAAECFAKIIAKTHLSTRWMLDEARDGLAKARATTTPPAP